jgi:MarR family transcriptional regulator, lower aerobic nicotinate degradation pathway regulator
MVISKPTNWMAAMSPVVPELTAHIGYWLRHVSNHVSHAFARKLAAKDVTVAEWALLRVLYGKEPMPPSKLADQMGLMRGAVSKLADRLIAKSLITRKASSEDGRAQTLRLTIKGAKFVPVPAALADQNEAECFAHLSNHDRRCLERILKETVMRQGLTSMPID